MENTIRSRIKKKDVRCTGVGFCISTNEVLLINYLNSAIEEPTLSRMNLHNFLIFTPFCYCRMNMEDTIYDVMCAFFGLFNGENLNLRSSHFSTHRCT